MFLGCKIMILPKSNRICPNLLTPVSLNMYESVQITNTVRISIRADSKCIRIVRTAFELHSYHS